MIILMYAFTNYDKNKHRKRCVLISHGNAGNMTFRGYLLDQFSNINCDVYYYEYSGFGKCEGDISINNCIKQHLFWLDYLNDRYEQIDLYGESIGGAILVETLYKLNNDIIINKIKNIYLDRTFSKIKNIIKKINPTLSLIYNILLFNDLNTYDKLDILKNKSIYIIHSKSDEIIPFDEAILNYNKCKELNLKVNLIEINGTHNNPVYNKNYYSIL